VSSAGSVTHWIEQLKAGDQVACQKLWEGYYRRLVGLARKRLQGTPRAAADEEDVALSAFDSFLRRAREGRFPRLHDRHDLWQLLVLIAGRKATNRAQYERRQRRGGGQVHHASALVGGVGSEAGAGLAELIGREPEPDLVAQVVEEYRRLLDGLGDEALHLVAVWKPASGSSGQAAAPGPVHRAGR
jgi:hypothetical protein